MTTQSGSRIAVIAAIAGNLIIAVIKFIAAALTGSSAMISEGIHSLVDTGNGGLVMLGMNRAMQPADQTHPFGHGKSLYFWTHIVAISVFAIGGGMSLYEGIAHISHVMSGAGLGDPLVAYIVLGISFLVEGGSFTVAVKQFLQAKGETDPGSSSGSRKTRASTLSCSRTARPCSASSSRSSGSFSGICSTMHISTAQHRLQSACC
jgi:cation diffusion facilitator family transporter